jgi:hypothetical protein
MGKRIALVSLAALCSLALGAIAASGADAIGVTAYTCVEKGGEHNTNAHCDPGSTGTFGHVLPPTGEDTQLTLKGLANTKLSGKLFGATVEFESTSLECEECTIENKTVNGEMDVSAMIGRLILRGVIIPGLPQCTVVEDSVAETPHTVVTEPLKFTAKKLGAVDLEPVNPPILWHWKIKTTPEVHSNPCPIIGTSGVAGKLPATLSGATLSINATKASGAITLEGEKASLTASITLTAGRTNDEHHAIALTES